MTKLQKKKMINKILSYVYSFLRFIIIFGLAFIILKPIITKLLVSFMGPKDMLDNAVNMVPKNPSLNYWKAAVQGLDLKHSLLNTVLLSIGVGIIQVISSTLVGYGLARFKFKLNGFFFFCVIMLMLIPIQTISTAQFLNFVFFNLGFTTVNLTDTFWPIFIMATGCVGIKQGLYIYLIREQFAAMPLALDEAACIDGAGVWQTFWKVMLPNARTIMVTIFLFSVSWQWTDNIYSALYYSNVDILANNLDNIQIAVGISSDSVGTLIARGAGSLIIMFPLLFLFAICQKFLVQSISNSGLAN